MMTAQMMKERRGEEFRLMCRWVLRMVDGLRCVRGRKQLYLRRFPPAHTQQISIAPPPPHWRAAK